MMPGKDGALKLSQTTCAACPTVLAAALARMAGIDSRAIFRRRKGRGR